MKGNASHEPLDHEKLSPPSARSTGFVFAAVFALIAFSARHTAWLWPLAALAGAFAAAAWLRPGLLEPLNRAWFRLSLLLSRIVTPIVMGVLFFGLITPFGLLMRLKGGDPLRLKRNGDEATWWRAREEGENDMNRQF